MEISAISADRRSERRPVGKFPAQAGVSHALKRPRQMQTNISARKIRQVRGANRGGECPQAKKIRKTGKFGIIIAMMDTKSIKEKLREMAKQDGDNALLPSVLLRLLEESEAQADKLDKAAETAPALAKEIKEASKGQADKQTELTKTTGSEQMSALDEFKKTAKMAAIAVAVAVPIVTAILVLAALKIFG